MTPDQPSPTCLICHFWIRNKQVKRGECVKAEGRMVHNVELEHTRYAYPATVSSDTCDEHRPKL